MKFFAKKVFWQFRLRSSGLLGVALFLIPILSYAQIKDKDTLRKIWYDRSGSIADSARFSAGQDLIKMYFSDPSGLDSMRMICEEMEVSGQQKSNNKWRANAWNFIGRYYAAKQQPDSAFHAYAQALQYTGSDQEAERVSIYANKGLLLASENQLDSAIVYLKHGIDLAKKYDHGKDKLATLYGNLSVCYINQGNYLEGIQSGQESVKYGNDHEKSTNYYNIGMAFKWLNLPDEAQLNFRLSQQFAERSTSPRDQILAYNALIEIAPTPGAVDSLYRSALLLCNEIKSTEDAFYILSSTATRYIDLKEYAKAYPLVEHCLDTLNVLHLETHRLIILIKKAKLLYISGKYQQSLALCNEIESKIENIENQNKVELYDLLSQNYEVQGNAGKALFYLRKKEAIANEIESTSYVKTIVSTYFKNKSEQEQQILQLQLDNSKKNAEAAQKRHTLTLVFFIVLASVLLVLAAFIYYYYQEKNQSARNLAHLNSQLQQEQENLQVQVAKLRRFSGIVSHDILSNLDLIVSTGNVLVGSKPKKEYLAQYFDVAQRTSRQLKDYCIRLLEEARHSQERLDSSYHNPMPVLKTVLDRFKPALDARHFKVEVSGLSPTHLHTALVEQVFQNLISNALHHAATAPEPLLRISETQDAQGRTCWMVEDNGPGLSPEQREIIFQGVKYAPTQEKSNQGMGLSLTRAALRSAGVDIRVENREGGGARFMVIFADKRTL